MKTRIAGLVSALLICTAAAVHADPIVITSGSAMVDPSGDPLRFSIGGDDFSAMGRWNTPFAVPFFSCSHGCGPGQIIQLSSSLENLVVQVAPAELAAAGSATVNGTSYPLVEFIGTMGFVTSSVTLPPLPPDQSGVTVTAPFSFSGVLQGWDPLTRDGVLLFTEQLVGTGEATLNLAASPSSYTFGTLSYAFTPSATPEPASLLLLGTGLVIARGLRKRRALRQTRSRDLSPI